MSLFSLDGGTFLKQHGSLEWMFRNANWSVKNMMTGTMFMKFCQFISDETDEVFGSDWQKSVFFLSLTKACAMVKDWRPKEVVAVVLLFCDTWCFHV